MLAHSAQHYEYSTGLQLIAPALMPNTKSLRDNELILVRHAPVAERGKLFGRTDAAAEMPSGVELSGLAAHLSSATRRVTSPALRCRQTAHAIWGEDAPLEECPTLWEQDFGDWEGASFDALPDLGTQTGQALAEYAPPAGESFADVRRRAEAKLLELASPQSGPTVACVHAGIVRACLAIAIESDPAALRFEVDCLSMTRFSMVSDGVLSIVSANERAWALDEA